MTDQFTGPIDFAVFVIPRTADVSAAARQLSEQARGGTLRVLDIEVLGHDDAAGGVIPLPLTTLSESEGDLVAGFRASESGLLDAEDLAQVAAELGADELAVVLIYEDRSLALVAGELAEAGGRLLWSGGVHTDELEAALEHAESH